MWLASEETRGSSGCCIPGLHCPSVASACSKWKGCEVLRFTCHLELSLVGKHKWVNTDTVSSGPLAGSVLEPSEIWGFLGSSEVTLIHQQKEHDTVLLLEEALRHLRNVTGVLTVFVQRKYGQQLSDRQGLALCQGWEGAQEDMKQLGENNSAWALGSESTVCRCRGLPLVGDFFRVLQSTRSEGRGGRQPLSQRAGFGGQTFSEVRDSRWCGRDPESAPQEETERKQSKVLICQEKHVSTLLKH